jgi:hypothetical protein
VRNLTAKLKNKINMKNLIKNLKYIFVLFSFIFLISCTKNEVEENFYTTKINGKVIRELTNERISGCKIYLEIVKTYGTGYGSYKKRVDVQNVLTDQNGNFTVNMKNSNNTYLIIRKEIDNIYGAYDGGENFVTEQNNLSIDLTVKIQKFINFRINVKNVTPVNDDDYIDVSFAYHRGQAIRKEILNFGIPNIIYPAEGGFGPRVETAWKGINVNSAILYSVTEDSQYYKLYWQKRKNGISTTGVTNDIPYDINTLNEYNYNY